MRDLKESNHSCGSSLDRVLANLPAFTPYLLTPLDHTLGSKDECVYQSMFYTFQAKVPSESLVVLEEATSRLVENWPFLAGEVVLSKDGNRLQVQPIPGGRLNKDEFFRIQHEKQNVSDNPLLRGCTQGMGLTVASTLDATYRPLPLMGVGSTQCFMRMQANVFQNAIILCMSINHTAVDGTGMGTILQGLAACCRAVSQQSIHVLLPTTLSQEEASRKLLSTVPVDARVKDVSAVYGSLAEDTSKWDDAMPVQNMTFYLSPKKVEALKRACNERLPRMKTNCCHDSVKFLSTGDVLNALIWICHSRAMEKTGLARASTTSVMFPVNARVNALPNLSRSYMGSAIAISRIVRDRQDLTKDHLHGHFDPTKSSLPESFVDLLTRLACDFRQSINETDSGYFFGVIANVLGRKNWNDIRIAHSDLSISNMASDATYTLDFGPKLQRITDFDMHGDCFSNLVYIKPRKFLESNNPESFEGKLGPHEICIFLPVVIVEAMMADSFLRWALIG